MALVLMENPLHGRNYFYSPAEVEQAKLIGWVEVVAPEPEPEAQKIAPAKPRR